jgi:hypothetical protein
VRPARAAAALLAACAIPACTAVLGLDDPRYGDVVAAICKCKQQVPASCDGELRAALAEASSADLSAWLQKVKDQQCAATCSAKTAACYYTAPGVCAQQGQACKIAAECCGYYDGAGPVGCTNGACGAVCDACKDLAKEGRIVSGTNTCEAAIAQIDALRQCATEQVGGASRCPKCDPGGKPSLECAACLQVSCPDAWSQCK